MSDYDAIVIGAGVGVPIVMASAMNAVDLIEKYEK